MNDITNSLGYINRTKEELSIETNEFLIRRMDIFYSIIWCSVCGPMKSLVIEAVSGIHRNKTYLNRIENKKITF